MAIRPFNSVGGFAVGENPTLIIDANGNVTTTTANLSGNVSAYGILSDNYYYANGSPVDFQQAAGSNNQIQFNTNNDFDASASLTYDKAYNSNAGLLSVGYGSNGEIKTDTLTVSNSIGASTLEISGLANVDSLYANGNVEANYFIGNGSQLTGLVSNTIFDGSSNVIVTPNDVTISVNGTTNVAAFTATGSELFGVLSVGNITTTTDANLILYPNGNGVVVIEDIAGGATGIQLGEPSQGNLTSNAISMTSSTTVTNGIAQLNEILGKLVPPSPPNFPASQSITVASLSTYRMANFTQTDNTPGANKSVAGGTTVTTVRRAASYSTNSITTAGPGDSGNIIVKLNGANAGVRTLTANLNGNGTTSNLTIFNNYDYRNANANIAAGFWSVFSANASGTVTQGWNEVYISDSAAGNTNTYSWYYDASAPGTPTFSNVAITAPVAPSYTYSSTVPHYNSTNQFAITFDVTKLSGDMYPTSDTFVTGAAAGAFGAPASKTYSDAGITTPLAKDLYVSSGAASISTTSNIVSGFGSSSTGPSVSVLNSYNTGTQAFSPGSVVMYKTGTASTMEEANVTIGSSIGSGSGLAFRIINPGSTDTPSYSANATAFNSQTGTLETYDATIVAASLKHDQTNYASGYLPAGPNLSTGRSAAQYFTFKFIRTSVSKFDIKWTGTIAGLWVALPGSGIDTSSTINGWLDASTAYAGAGQPGAGAGGNGSNGCALGGVAPLNSAQTNKSITATFGTVSSSSTATNEIYVRIKLTSGQTVSALSLQTASN
jgi:hypothetical protein